MGRVEIPQAELKVGHEPGREHAQTGSKSEPDELAAEPPVRRMRYQEAFEFAPDCQIVTDAQGIILQANHAAVDLLCCRKEFLIGKPLALFAVQGWRTRFYDCLGQLGRGIPKDAFETKLACGGGPPREAQVVARTGDRVSDPTERVTVHWLVRDVTQWRRSEAARAELQRRLITAQEDERRRVARDLHDTTGQLLTALSLGVRAAQDAGPLPAAAQGRLEHVQQLIDELAQQVCDLASRLRPTVLDDLGLEAAVQQLVANWSARTGVEADFHAAGLYNRRFTSEVETVLFRVVQESLTNVAKYARARHVSVVIGQSDGHAIAVVEDDGVGFDVENVTRTPTPGRDPDESTRIGLLGMRERTALIGGTLQVESTLGQGTTVIARIPLSDTAAQ